MKDFLIRGLTEAEAAARLAGEGRNELPAQQNRGVLAIVAEVVREPMFLMLLAAGVLYLLMGEPGDALMLLGFVIVVMAITIIQERRTERALDALRDLSSPRALVVRDGATRRIPGAEVVRGDWVILAEGDRVPADALLRQGDNLFTDESLLTGESAPVRKTAAAAATALGRPGGDDSPALFSGTLVTAGQGLAEVVSIGAHTELGRIGKALQQVESEDTLLQQETARLVRTFALLGLAACVVVVFAYALTRGGGALVWKEGVLAGIAMAMAILPEEFPVVLTVFLAFGAWRISRRNVLTRRMPAIETLGAATVLCVDKTGTLTLNQMTLRRLVADGRDWDLAQAPADLPAAALTLIEHAVLASRADPFDPMERALHDAGRRLAAGRLHADWTLLREYPLTNAILAVSQAWRTGEPDRLVVAVKGAPEAIADLCHLSPAQHAVLAQQTATLASAGLRVLGVARGAYNAASLPERHHDLELEWLGLVGLEDPVRPGVPAAVAECRTAGVRVIMITGDYPATAQSIARQAGFSRPDSVIAGPELDRMTDDELVERIRDVQVFARVVPEQKLRIVQALKAHREIVAMTGDGVNDAPALKAAHIGVAMGGRGTDVARESAALVLVDDDFSSIVGAIRLGRRIFDNIRKAIAFILTVHVPIAGLSILPVFLADWPLLLLPVHIVFLELIIDPACSLIFEAEEAEADVMRRPPRSASVRLFSRHTVGMALVQGVCVLAACLAVLVAGRMNHTPDAARTLMFATLVVSFLFVILINRSWTRTIFGMWNQPNRALRWVVGGAALLLAVVLTFPPAQAMFHFAPPHGRDLVLSLAAGVACVSWFELYKLMRRRTPAP